MLRAGLKGLSTPLALVLSGRQVDVLGTWEDETDCTVITYTSMLPRLCDRQQLTTPTRNGELEVQGNIQVVQNFIVLVNLTELDPTELLAPYIGDTAMERVSKVSRGGVKFLCHNFQRQQRYITEAIIEEWHVAPGPLEAAWLAEGTAAVERTVESLAKRLEKLEAK